MKSRTINKIIPSQKVRMGENIIDQPLPNHVMGQLDPFLLIHHLNIDFEGNQHPRMLGVGPHPHRGFSPITYVFKGDVRHQDSFGNDQIVTEGGTQWMHAGRGITHSERPSKDLAENGGTQELIQFWINSPAKHKMDIPTYKPFTKEEIPTIVEDDYILQLVSGSYKGLIGPAKSFSPVLLLRGEIRVNGQVTIDTIPHFNTLLYQLDGNLKINDKHTFAKDLIWYNNDYSSININAEADTRFIILSGEPINEEIVHSGPFVMNSQTEIMEAIRDAQIGKMGILIENFK